MQHATVPACSTLQPPPGGAVLHGLLSALCSAVVGASVGLKLAAPVPGQTGCGSHLDFHVGGHRPHVPCLAALKVAVPVTARMCFFRGTLLVALSWSSPVLDCLSLTD